jgi:hypothetical protein
MTVAIGVIGSLVGVIFGAFLTRWLDSLYERRKEVRRAITAALILSAELRDAKNGLQVFVDDRETSDSFLFHGLDSWEQHREALLAAGMEHAAWNELASIFRHLLELVPKVKQREVNLPDRKVEILESAVKDCDTGLAILQPFTPEGKISFLHPESIFP